MAPGWPIRGNCNLHGPSSCCCTNQLHLCRVPESCHWIGPGIRFGDDICLYHSSVQASKLFATYHAR